MIGNANYWADGQWNFICGLCGGKNKSSDAVLTWDNQRVCRHHKEVRNPQDFVRGIKDRQTTAWSRSDETGNYIGPTCWIWSTCAYAGLGTAGCMQAGYTPIPYAIAYQMKFPTQPWLVPDLAGSAEPSYMIPGYAIPSVLPTNPPMP